MATHQIDPEVRKNNARFFEHTATEYDRLRRLHADTHIDTFRPYEERLYSDISYFEDALSKERSQVDASLLQLTSAFTKAVHQTRNKVNSYLDDQQRIFQDNITYLKNHTNNIKNERVSLPEFDRVEFQTRLDKTSEGEKGELIQNKYNEVQTALRQVQHRQNAINHYQTLYEKIRNAPRKLHQKNAESYQDLYNDFETALNNIVAQYNPQGLKPFHLKRIPGEALQVNLRDYFRPNVVPSLHYFQPGTSTLQILALPSFDVESTINSKRLDLDTNYVIPDYHGTVTTPEGRIFLLGGIDTANEVSRRVSEYDPKTNRLVKRSDMGVARYGFAIVYAKNHIYVFGGYGQKGEILASNEVYNIKTDTWTPLPDGNVAAAQATVANFKDAYIYRFGGYLPDGSLNLAVERYSIAERIWTVVVSHHENKVPIYPLSATAQINHNEILIFGGVDQKGKGVKNCLILRVDYVRSGNSIQLHEDINEFPEGNLPIGDGFWDEQTIAQGNRIFVLQNLSGQKGEVVGRRVLEFKNKTWSVLSK